MLAAQDERDRAHDAQIAQLRDAQGALKRTGGVVLSAGMHPQYGQLVELDHGNGLVTRYAHTSKMLVKQGDLVRQGQAIAEVGSTGRSTGPHLHFEVLVEGVQQDPAKFLAGRASAPALAQNSNR